MNRGFGIIGSLVLFVVLFLIYLPPLIRILHKAGYSGWWILVSFIPLVNIVMLWIFAFADWPSLSRGSASTTQL